jgi:release factor glutamine methyltransferase
VTYRLAILAGERRLQGSPTAGQDAELLLRLLTSRDRAWIIAHPDEELTAEQAEEFECWLDRRGRREPIQYITGECEFYGLPFKVMPDVLIPRPETEHLVEKVLELAQRFENPRIIDIGTGSGAIAVTLAHIASASRITATDVSDAALTVARENAKLNGVEPRIRFSQGDLFAPVAGERFDLVVANPPYVPSVERETMSVEVRDYEPALALFAGIDGLDIYRRLISAAPNVLVPGGFIALEIGYGQAPAVEGLLAAAGFRQIESIPDLQGIPRVAWARLA